MEAAITLADLAEVYPDPSDHDYNRKIAEKKEFSGPEYTPPLGDSRAHQRNMFRLLSSQSGPQSIMMVWPTGTGKSRVPKDIIRHIIDLPARFGSKVRCIIAVKASVIPAWQAEFAKSPEFTTAKLRDETTTYEAQGRTHALSAAIKKKVKLVRLDKFAKDLSKLRPEEIRADYSVDMIVIDEAHFLRTVEDIKTLDESTVVNPRDLHYDAKITYIQMKRLVKYAVFGLRIALTATPMYDNPLELVSTLSFTQPEDKQLTVAEFSEALARGREALKAYLEPKLRGHISFISGFAGLPPIKDEGKSFVRVLEDGEEVESTIKVVNVKMLPEQEAVYNAIVAAEKTDAANKAETHETFYNNSRQALRFVFLNPYDSSKNTNAGFEDEIYDGKVVKESFIIVTPPLPPPKDKKKKKQTKIIGKQGPTLEEQIEEDTRKKQAQEKREKRKEMTKAEKVHRFRFRFEEELFKGCPPRPENLKQFGVGSQLDQKRLKVIRRMSAEFAEIIRFVHEDMLYPNEGEMAFYFHPWIRNGGCILLGMCFELMGYERFDGLDSNAELLDDRPRYAFMTGEPGSTAARNRNIRDVANHPSNRFGQKIMIVLASDVSAVGISFVNARKFIHGGATFSLFYQPEGRVRRTDSLRYFTHARQKFVRRYLMATMTQAGEQTVDHYLWWRVQEKDFSIEPVMEVLSEISVESGLFNTDVREEYGTLPGVPRRDLTTYHLFWADREIAAIEQKIRECYRIKTSWSLTEFYALYASEHDARTIAWTLADMVTRRDIISDRFGFPHPLREHSGIYFLGSLTSSGRLEEEYVKALRIPASESFKEIAASVVQVAAQKEESVSLADFKKTWEVTDTATAATRVASLENALLGKISDPEISRFILTDLVATWFRSSNYIFHYLEEMRPKGNSGKYQFNRERIDAVKEPVTIRILDNNSKSFRNANLMETNDCVNIINKTWSAREDEIREKLESLGAHFILIYNISSDREYRIKKIVEKKVSKTTGKQDGRSNKGKEWDLFTPFEILEFLWELRIENPDGPESVPDQPAFLMKEIGKVANQNWPIERMKLYYGWLISENHGRRLRMFKALKDFCIRENLLFVK